MGSNTGGSPGTLGLSFGSTLVSVLDFSMALSLGVCVAAAMSADGFAPAVSAKAEEVGQASVATVSEVSSSNLAEVDID